MSEPLNLGLGYSSQGIYQPEKDDERHRIMNETQIAVDEEQANFNNQVLEMLKCNPKEVRYWIFLAAQNVNVKIKELWEEADQKIAELDK